MQRNDQSEFDDREKLAAAALTRYPDRPRRRRRIPILLFLLALPLTPFMIWYTTVYKVYRWNQEISVILDTPEGPVTGSAISSVEWSRNGLTLPDTSPWGRTASGDAIPIRLPDGRYAFALLDNIYNIAPQTIAYSIDPEQFDKPNALQWLQLHQYLPKIKKVEGVRLPVPEAARPQIIVYDDRFDLTTGKIVSKDSIIDVLGERYEIVGVFLRITHQDRTPYTVHKILGDNITERISKVIWKRNKDGPEQSPWKRIPPHSHFHHRGLEQ